MPKIFSPHKKIRNSEFSKLFLFKFKTENESFFAINQFAVFSEKFILKKKKKSLKVQIVNF